MKSSPKLCILTCDFDPPRGGLGRALQELYSILVSQGADVTVATPATWHCGWMQRIPGGHLLFSMLLPFVLAPHLRREGYTVLIVPVGPGGVWLLRRPRGVNVIAIAYHTYAQQQRDVPHERWKRLFIPFERRTLQIVADILCYARETAALLERGYGIPCERIAVLPQLLPLHRWSYSAGQREERLCVYVGRLEQRKGIEILLAAWTAVRRQWSDARLIVVGRGPLEHLVIANVHHGVTHCRSLPQADLQALLARATLAVCPSYLEGFGLAAAEAMLCGAPLVCSACDGLQSLVTHDRTGLLVPPGNPAALADALCRLLGDGALRERLAAEAAAMMRARFAREPATRQHVRAILGESGEYAPSVNCDTLAAC
jgi:glycosyltransferase involved in cell wall biosynthesis